MTNEPHTAWVYIGAYTHGMPFVQGTAAGIAVCRLDYATGRLTFLQPVTGVVNPSYLTVDPRQQYLYCVEEYAAGARSSGEVSAFRIDAASGALTHLNRQPSHGIEPAHINMDRQGRWVLVANYGSGSIAVYPVQDDGSLGAASDVAQHLGSSSHPQRQSGPHAHWLCTDPANRFLLVADLGLDALVSYPFDSQRGTLGRAARSDFRASPGAGPRHAVFRPDGRFVYLVNELDSTIVALAYDAATGRLSALQTLSTLPDGYSGSSYIAAVRVTPDGRFVYASNRGHDSIAIFGSDPATGLLECLGFEPTQGRTPRDFAIDPTGTFLLAANQDSDSIVTFRLDQRTGRLAATGETSAVATPVCLAIVPQR